MSGAWILWHDHPAIDQKHALMKIITLSAWRRLMKLNLRSLTAARFANLVFQLVERHIAFTLESKMVIDIQQLIKKH